jgi:hypothetical protein
MPVRRWDQHLGRAARDEAVHQHDISVGHRRDLARQGGARRRAALRPWAPHRGGVSFQPDAASATGESVMLHACT